MQTKTKYVFHYDPSDTAYMKTGIYTSRLMWDYTQGRINPVGGPGHSLREALYNALYGPTAGPYNS